MPMRPSQPGRHGTQSLAALVSSSRVTKPVSVRSITQRSFAAQPTSEKITGRATGVVSSIRRAAAKSLADLEGLAQAVGPAA